MLAQDTAAVLIWRGKDRNTGNRQKAKQQHSTWRWSRHCNEAVLTLGSQGLLTNAEARRSKEASRRSAAWLLADCFYSWACNLPCRERINCHLTLLGTWGFVLKAPQNTKTNAGTRRNTTLYHHNPASPTPLSWDLLFLWSFCVSHRLPLPSFENQTQSLTYARQCFTNLPMCCTPTLW